jgi:hypothetical protein
MIGADGHGRKGIEGTISATRRSGYDGVNLNVTTSPSRIA